MGSASSNTRTQGRGRIFRPRSYYLHFLATERRKLPTSLSLVLKEGYWSLPCPLSPRFNDSRAESERAWTRVPHCSELRSRSSRGGVHSHTQPVASAHGAGSVRSKPESTNRLCEEMSVRTQESGSGISVTNPRKHPALLYTPLARENVSEIPGIVTNTHQDLS